jgi:Protein of unknown function (DUF3108)
MVMPEEFSMILARLASVPVFLAALVMTAQAAEPTTVNYTMSIAGLPIGSASMTIAPNGSSTAVSIAGKAGGPLGIGRMNATAVIAAGNITAQSQSGSGNDVSNATLVSRGQPGNSSFSYTGTSSRGPGKIAMTMAASRVTVLEKEIPDNPKAVRVPVTDAHKLGVVDPLSVLGMVFKPGGTMQPENLCGKSYAVFTGQARFTMAGSPVENRAAVSGMPEGYRAVACKVTVTPVSGHRTDKGSAAEPRTANLVFATSSSDVRTVLWSLSVPGTFGSFSLIANAIK